MRRALCLARWLPTIVALSAAGPVTMVSELMAHRRDELVARIRSEIEKQRAATAAAAAAQAEQQDQEAA